GFTGDGRRRGNLTEVHAVEPKLQGFEGLDHGQVPASAVWRPSQGRVLGAVELNGEPVRLGNHDRYYPDNLPFTGAIWIRPVALSTTAVALVDFDPFFQFRAATDRLQLIRGRDSLTSSVGLTAGAWHHLAVVQTLEALELWLDGVNLGEVPTAPTVAGKANGRFGADAAVLFDEVVLGLRLRNVPFGLIESHSHGQGGLEIHTGILESSIDTCVGGTKVRIAVDICASGGRDENGLEGRVAGRDERNHREKREGPPHPSKVGRTGEQGKRDAPFRRGPSYELYSL
ncbi:MAG: LamG-like jellyroll fold domain-containing protein, partial [Myxococcota bacterium]